MRNAMIYDLVMAPFERLVLGGWRKDLLASAEGTVLDIGAGTGYTLRHYRQPDAVVLLDSRLSLLQRARRRVSSVDYPVHIVTGDAMHLPFPHESFDTVVVALAMCTIARPVQAFHEIGRVLRHRGRLLMLEHVRVRKPPVAALQDLLTPVWCVVSGGCHLNRPTLDIAEACGFEATRVQRGMGGWLVAATLRRVKEQLPG